MLAILERTLEPFGGAGTVVVILAVVCGILAVSNMVHAYLVVLWRRRAMLWRRRYLDQQHQLSAPEDHHRHEHGGDSRRG